MTDTLPPRATSSRPSAPACAPRSFESKIEGHDALVRIHAGRVEYQKHGFDKRKANEVILLKHVSSLSVANDAIGNSAVVVRTGTLDVTVRPGREGANRMHDLVIALLPR